MGHALHLDRTRLITQSDRILEAREVNAISGLAARRLKREPVSRILGKKEFWSLALAVTPDVLVPRPETETVIEGALDFVVRSGLRMEKVRILDIGTGSGALLVALLNELPNAAGVGTDVSRAALQTAQTNVTQCGFETRCSLVACDIAAGVAGPFDLVVSNPPYIARGAIASLAPEVRDYDPIVALDGGDRLPFHFGGRKAAFGSGRTAIRGTGRGPGTGGTHFVYQCGVDGRDCAQGLRRNAACTRRGFRVMSVLHSHPMKIAELIIGEKTSWIIPRKRLASGHGIDP
jgi:hypothetical protein